MKKILLFAVTCTVLFVSNSFAQFPGCPAVTATTNGIVKLQAENADSTALTILDVITVDACDTVVLAVNLNTVAIVGVWEAQAFSIEK